MGIHRIGTGESAVTNIEANAQGHGGMQVSSEQVLILDGTATFTNATTQSDGGTISFDGKFDSAQGMTVGNSFTLDGTGKISKVTGIDVQGALTTTGTINSMTIANNQVNGVTLQNNNVTANTITGTDVTDGTYHLSQVGRDVADIVSDVEEIAEKTQGIASYDAMTGTTFTGNVRASGGLVTGTGTISDTNNNSFTVAAASEAIKNVGDLTTRMDTAEGEIDTLQGVVGDEEKGLVKDVNDLNTKTTGMSYNESTGTTFAKDVTATDFKIGNTSLNAVAQAVNDPTKGLTATNDIANANKTNIDTINSTINNTETGLAAAHTKIGALDGRVTTAEGEVDALQSTTTDHESRITANTNKISTLNTTVEGHTTQISGLNTRVGAAETDISALEQKTHGFDKEGNNLTVNSITATTGTVGGVTFNGGEATGLTNISGASITVAGNTLTNGRFNGVAISNYTTNGSTGATINGISIYQDTEGHYNVGTIDLNDLTGGGSGATVEGIVRTDNTPQVDDDNNFTTTIEGALAVNSETGNATVTGEVTAKDFVVNGGASLSSVAGQVNNTTTGLAATYDIATANKTAIEDTTTGLKATYDIATANKAAIENEKTGLDALNAKTSHFNDNGDELTGLKNITSEKGTIGGITFETVDGVKTIGTAADTINLAGNAISKGSFNGVAIGVESGHATFNGVSIYKDEQNENDVMVGGINLSDLQSGTSTKLEGIVRKPNAEGGGYTTTIEGALEVNSATHEISNADESFKVAADGTVTGTDFVIDDNTKLSTVAQATTGMTYADGKTNFAQEVKATNVTTTAGADLNALSETVGDEKDGLVKDVVDLNAKTTNLSADGSTLTNMTNIESAKGTFGGVTFEKGTATGLTNIAGDTITIAGAAITSNSFNEVLIEQKDDDHYWVGDVDVSALEAGNTEITNKLRGITYSNEQGDDYTMTFAGVMSVSTTGEYKFNYKGQSYGLDDLINTVDSEHLADVEELKGKVEALEDKTTGIEFNKDTGETTISHMNGTDTDTDGVNDTFTKGDSFLAVNENGITANGDTFVKGESGSAGGGSGAGTGTEKSDHFVDGNQTVGGDQYVNGDQYVTGDVNATNGNYTGSVGVGGDVFIDANGDHQLNDGEISLSGVNQKVEDVSIKVDGIGDVSSVNSNIAGDSDEDGTNDLAGAVNNEYQQRVEADNALNERINSIDNRMGELEDRIDKVGAMAAAIANLRTMGYDPAAPTEIAVGIGQYRSETGAALGLFHYPNRDFMLSLSVSTSGDEVMGGIGATWKFGRKSPEKAAAEKAEKARAAKLQKAEAIKEAARLKKIEAQQQRHAKLAAEKAAE